MAWTAFISSTYADLKEHRAATAEALRNAGFHPVDMIHFMARPEGATQACLDEVAAADIFIGVYAHRYGHVPDGSDISITEQEFEAARRLGKPCFCFVVEDAHPWPESEREGGENGRKLSAFKRRIDRTLVRSAFTTPADLAVKVLASLKRWELKGVPQAGSRPEPARTRPENETILLRRVSEAWIDGVLKNALHHELAIQLEKESRPEAVAAMRELFAGSVAVSGGGTPSPSQDVADIFETSGGALLILGAPGSGKTVTLLELARSLIETAKADPSGPVPVVLNLSSWTDRYSELEPWIAEELFRSYRIPRKVAKAWAADAEGHPLIFLLDGLDEVPPALRARCAAAVNRLRETHGFSGVAVACREADYETLHEKLQLESAVRILPLDDGRIRNYLDALGPDLAALKQALETDAALEELARTPLMLSIMTLAYHGAASRNLQEDAGANPETRRKNLFNAYVRQMLGRRRSPKDPSDEKTLRWLSWLADYMASRHTSVFFIENLQPDCFSRLLEKLLYLFLSRLLPCCLLLIAWSFFVLWVRVLTQWTPLDLAFEAGRRLIQLGPIIGLLLAIFDLASFPVRRKLQTEKEKALFALVCFFLLTLAVSNLSFSTMGLVIQWMNPAMTIPIWKEKIELIYDTNILGVTNLGLFLGLFFTARNANASFSSDIRCAESAKWDWKAFLIFYSFSGILPSILLGLVWRFDPFLMAFFFLVPSLLISFFFSLRFDTLEKRKTRPNQGILMSMKNAALIGPGFGTFIALLFIVAGPVMHLFPGHVAGAVCFGLVLSIVTGIWYGGFDVINHYALRVLVFIRGQFPLNCVRFLDSATNRILMRKVGGGYIFIHRLLLEHFAAMKNERR